MPYVFTEQGIAMLSAVLRSDTAIQISINIMNAAVRLFLSQIPGKHLVHAIPDPSRNLSRLRLSDSDLLRHRQYILHHRVHPVSAYGGRVLAVQRVAVSKVVRRRKAVAGVLLVIQIRKILGVVVPVVGKHVKAHQAEQSQYFGKILRDLQRQFHQEMIIQIGNPMRRLQQSAD